MEQVLTIFVKFEFEIRIYIEGALIRVIPVWMTNVILPGVYLMEIYNMLSIQESRT